MPAEWLKSRRVLLVGACIVGLSGGTNFAYSAYSRQLGRRLGLNSKQLAAVSSSANIGMYCAGPFIGLSADRFGPTKQLLVALALLLPSYRGIALLYAGGPEGAYSVVGLPGLAFLQLLTGIGSSTANAAASNSLAHSFAPAARGKILSLLYACFGLSALVYATIYRWYVIPHTPAGEDPVMSFFDLLAYGCTCSYLIGLVTVKRRPWISSPPVKDVIESDDLEEEPVAEPSERTPLARELKPPDDGISGRQLLRSVDFWALFFLLGALSGVGLLWINNMSLMISALAPAGTTERELAEKQGQLVAVFSGFNAVGRVLGGVAGDAWAFGSKKELKRERIWAMIAVATLYLISQIEGLRTAQLWGWTGIRFPVILTGFAHGLLFGTIPILVLETFGVRHFSANNGLFSLAPAIFGGLTNSVFGSVYDASIERSENPASKICSLGRTCYRPALQFTCVLAGLAVGVGIFASVRRWIRNGRFRMRI